MAAKPGKSTDILDAVALLVVDMQRSFLDVIEGAPVVIERCGFAIEAARSLGLRVLFTEQVPAKLGPTDPRLHALVPGARVFAKNTFSALQAEGLRDYLKRQGIYHLLIAGIEIPVCIYQTALHACDSDFDVTVLSDCVTGRRVEDCLITLDALTRANCHVLPSESVYYSMLGSSGHTLFPAFNELVKRYNQVGGLDAAPPPPEVHNPQHERRPRLAAPEDRADATEADEPVADFPEGSGEDEPYIGRNVDSAPAENDHARGGDEEAPSESRSGDDEDREVEGGEQRGSDGDEDDREDSSGDAPAEAGDSAAGDEASGPRRRGRRRRGGARRRRARERAAGGPGGGGHAGDGRPGEQPRPAGEPPSGASESDRGAERENSPASEHRPAE